MQQDEKRIAGLVPTRLTLSDDKGLCTMYFTCEDDAFLKKLETLKLYKPSIRKQLSSNLPSRCKQIKLFPIYQVLKFTEIIGILWPSVIGRLTD